MTEMDWKEIDSRIDSVTRFIGDHVAGLKRQMANQPCPSLENIEKKLDQIIQLLEMKQ